MGGRLEEADRWSALALRDDQWDRIKDILPGQQD
jgi:hypothetical protein